MKGLFGFFLYGAGKYRWEARNSWFWQQTCFELT